MNETTKQAIPATYVMQVDEHGYFVYLNCKRASITYCHTWRLYKKLTANEHRYTRYKSSQISSLFFTALNKLSATIQQALQNRTPHLNGEKYLANREVCQLLRISSRTLQIGGTRENTFIRLQGKILHRESDIVK